MLWLAFTALALALEDPIVFDRTGPYGRVVVQVSDEGRRTMTIDGSLQSTWHPDSPTAFSYGYLHAAAAAVTLAESPPDSALVIGLGGGTFSRWLMHHHDTRVRAIELDRRVLRAARRWFDLPRDVRVTIGDGRARLEQDRRRYDLIVIDAASEAGVPEHLLTLEFLEEVRAHLTPRGLVIANSWGASPLAAAESATWLTAFGDTWEVRYRQRGEENRILMAGPGLGAVTVQRAASTPGLPAPERIDIVPTASEIPPLRDPN